MGDEARSEELKNPGYELFIAAISVLSILNLLLITVVADQVLDYVIMVMNGLLSGILFLDFLYRLATAPSRTAYFVRGFGWADLLASLPVSQLKVLRVFRLVRVGRLLARGSARGLGQRLATDRGSSALFTLLLVAILVLEFGSLVMLRLESDAEGANITSASDALWYVIVTMATVGYGDTFPVTNPGRLLGSVVIVIGVGVFGTLTGYLANAFLGARDKRRARAAGATAEDEVERKLRELNTAMAQQQEALAELDRLLHERRGS